MAKLVQQGKVRALGLSEAVAEDHRARAQGASDRGGAERILAALSRAGRRHPQDHPRARHLVRRLCAARPRPAHRRTSPIRRRLSEGDTRKRQPRYAGDNLAHNRALAQKVEAIAKRKGCTPAQLALAWVLAQGPDVIPIPGTKQKKRLMENIGALNVSLSRQRACRDRERGAGRRCEGHPLSGRARWQVFTSSGGPRRRPEENGYGQRQGRKRSHRRRRHDRDDAGGVALKQSGIGCEIVEIRPALTEPGTGISLQGPALRALQSVGMVDRCIAHRLRIFAFMNACDAAGQPSPDDGRSCRSVLGACVIRRRVGDACRRSGLH